MGICFSAGDVSSGLLIFSAMQQEDDLKALENIVQFARGLGVFFLCCTCIGIATNGSRHAV